MQSGAYGPAQSPPLHHPVPQHVSSVPQFRSPPPPSQSANGYGYGGQQPQQQQQQQQQGGGFGQPQFGGFMNEQTAQLGYQFMKGMMPGQDVVEQNVNRYLGMNASKWKHYFNVSNSYVVNKLIIVLFPWRHRPWTRRQGVNSNGQDSGYLPPREDVNSPDMYIPVMAFVTYILLSALLAGLQGAFHPELLGLTATTAIVVVGLELMSLKLGCYLLSVTSDSQLLDLVAYSGYKFVGIIVTILVGEIGNAGAGTGGWIGWSVFLYTYLALAFFLLRSLKYVLLPESGPNGPAGAMQTVARAQRNRRTQFLFVYSYVVQLIFMWILSRQDPPKLPGS